MAQEKKEIRIKSVSMTVHDELVNIATYYGISLQDLLRPKLRDIADSYPNNARTYKRKEF